MACRYAGAGSIFHREAAAAPQGRLATGLKFEDQRFGWRKMKHYD